MTPPTLESSHRHFLELPFTMTYRILFVLSIVHACHAWIVVDRSAGMHPHSFTVQSTILPRTLLREAASDADDDDDGWGTSPSRVETKTSELMQLQKERRSSSLELQKSSAQRRGSETERDLFIPIFSIVSLAGLFGSYGYEMLRLYSRGELYLPWDK